MHWLLIFLWRQCYALLLRLLVFLLIVNVFTAFSASLANKINQAFFFLSSYTLLLWTAKEPRISCKISLSAVNITCFCLFSPCISECSKSQQRLCKNSFAYCVIFIMAHTLISSWTCHMPRLAQDCLKIDELTCSSQSLCLMLSWHLFCILAHPVFKVV